jgi:hypothetical protein
LVATGVANLADSFFHIIPAGGGTGPTAVFLKQQSGRTYGILANHLWSYAGSSNRSEVNATYLQPFLTYTNKSHTSLG